VLLSFINVFHCFSTAAQLAFAGKTLVLLFPITDNEKMVRKEHVSMTKMTSQATQVLHFLEFGEYSLFSQMISVGSAASII